METDYDEEEVDRAYKIIILGNSAVGKTSLINRFLKENFIFETMKTIGIETYNKVVEVCGLKINLIFWDTSGQVIYRQVLPSFYSRASGVIIVFDVSNRQTFEDLKIWLDEIKRHSNVRDAIKVLIGNKIDCERQVSTEEASAFAKKYDLAYLESSAKDDINVQKSFEYIAKKISKNRESLMQYLRKENEQPRMEKGKGKQIMPKHKPKPKQKGFFQRIFCFCSRDHSI